jgi:hypothetical protein
MNIVLLALMAGIIQVREDGLCAYEIWVGAPILLVIAKIADKDVNAEGAAEGKSVWVILSVSA